MPRTVLTLLLLVPALAACGARPARVATTAALPQETVLAEVGDSLVAVDGHTGRTLRRMALGAHDASVDAVYTAQSHPDTGTTSVTATEPVTGRSRRVAELPGRWTIPVAAGFTPEGAVSGNGRVLVLAGPSAERHSRFALLQTGAAGAPAPRVFSLPARYSFDAMSPDASVLYLNEVRGDGRYRVRAYDAVRARLLPRVVVDKTTVGLVMQGVAVARAVDPTGSPVHTLYRSGPGGAFVHSLNTQEGTALCIFLPDSRRAGPTWRLTLDRGDGVLHAVDAARGARYVVDPATGEVTPQPRGVPLPDAGVTGPDGARSYAATPGGTIVVEDRAGERIGTLPSPGAGAEVVAVRAQRR